MEPSSLERSKSLTIKSSRIIVEEARDLVKERDSDSPYDVLSVACSAIVMTQLATDKSDKTANHLKSPCRPHRLLAKMPLLTSASFTTGKITMPIIPVSVRTALSEAESSC